VYNVKKLDEITLLLTSQEGVNSNRRQSYNLQGHPEPNEKEMLLNYKS
jgi:hypothetical protein